MGQQLCCVSPDKTDTLSPEDSLRPLLGQNYDRIKDHCLKTGKLFEDPLFPASSSSLSYHLGHRVTRQWMRPREITAQFGVEPEFFVGGGSASDLVQGELGNCWVVAAASSLADHPQLLDQVVPTLQSFTRGDYAGIFKFNFYVYGEWIQVVVDDRLPTDHGRMIYVHSGTLNEFWGALLEKAYAKLLGCYQALEGGVCADALTCFTGGVSETYRLKNDTPHNIGRILLHAVNIGSLICTGIWGVDNIPMENGLVTGHAFSVTDVQQTPMINDDRWITLIRVRNPWGNFIEWKGRWSDRSRAWAYVSDEIRNKLRHKVQDDGEFWMDLNDFIRNFDQVDICHMTHDSPQTGNLRRWQSTSVHGSWIRRRSAGGRLKFYETFASNPQVEFQIGDLTFGNDRQFVSIIVELTQKRRRSRAPHDPLFIGFVLYQLHSDHFPPMPALFFQEQPRVGAVESYDCTNIVAKRFTVPAGRYLVVPSTWEPGEEGSFQLRVWSQAYVRLGGSGSQSPSSATSYTYPAWNTKSERDRKNRSQMHVEHEILANQDRRNRSKSPKENGHGPAEPLLPYEHKTENGNGTLTHFENPKIFTRMSTQLSDVQNRSAFKLLKSYAGRDMTFNAEQLQRAINSSYAKPKSYRVALDCCRSLIALVDNENSFKIYSDQFLILYSFLEVWTENFKTRDRRRTGHLDQDQFSSALYDLSLLPLKHAVDPVSQPTTPKWTRLPTTDHSNGTSPTSPDQSHRWLQPIYHRFCDQKTNRVSYSEFVNCCSKLIIVDGLLEQSKSRYSDGMYSMSAEQILLAMLKS